MAIYTSPPSPDNNQESLELEDPGLFSSFPPSEHDMTKEKERPRLEILVDSDCLFLKGTGSDVEPALLSGHVALNLTESTSFKEITLKFRGKARLPFTESCVIKRIALR
jgi:arrestin-related trafficking adapter 4/5/7